MKNKISLGAMIFIFIVFATLRLYYHPKRIFSYDVFGYYLYLPSLVIQNDPGLHDLDWVNKINEQYKATPSLYQVSKTTKGNWAIRFYSGIAIMYTPFFIAGHIYALSSTYPADGFSEPYQWAIIISGIFYTLLGVWFMRKLLLKFFNDKNTAITLLLLFIGSNIFFFSTLGNDVPHVYIFTLITILLYLTVRWHSNPKLRTAAGIGLITGLIAICRASGFLAILIPLFWGVSNLTSFKEKIHLLKKNYRHVAVLIAATTLAVFPQFLYWIVNTGQLIFNAYDDPQSGLDIFNSRLGYVLFGFRKGLYIYSPMMIFATIGFFQLYKYNRKIFLPILLFFLANTYLIACYSSLVSFGWRAFIETYAVLAIPLAYFVYSVFQYRKILKFALIFLLFLFTVLNLFKIYQLSVGVIDGSRMTKEYYLATFFKLNVTDADRELLLIKRSETNRDEFLHQENYQKRNLSVNGFEEVKDINPNYLEDSIVYRGKYSYKMDSANIFTPAYRMRYKDITSHDHAWIRASVYIYPTNPEELNEALLVVDFKNRKGVYKYRAFRFVDFSIDAKAGQWNLLSFDYLTPEVRSTKDLLEVYIWYRGKSPCYIDELTVDVFEKK